MFSAQRWGQFCFLNFKGVILVTQERKWPCCESYQCGGRRRPKHASPPVPLLLGTPTHCSHPTTAGPLDGPATLCDMDHFQSALYLSKILNKPGMETGSQWKIRSPGVMCLETGLLRSLQVRGFCKSNKALMRLPPPFQKNTKTMEKLFPRRRLIPCSSSAQKPLPEIYRCKRSERHLFTQALESPLSLCSAAMVARKEGAQRQLPHPTALCRVLLLPPLDAAHTGEGEERAYCEGRVAEKKDGESSTGI
ncbi:PREDICTED: uncharacterized protein LOC108506860 isoform X2 [Lepidothrix coronata]|uniref:Uncharacterized protein LOC108506860 isoform X2 n=1 Tax=Lepidothrix coronata TaxID=321398 RepID=A0A6J0ISW3_9PASS|nr:PREDICTED: uncharacterized protein LOC108506860 isoform X2 [Lepidothrix coronata]